MTRSKQIAVFTGILLVAAAEMAFAATPSNPTPPLPQPDYKRPLVAGDLPLRVFTQWELHARQVYRAADGDFRESPGSGGGAGGGAGDASGAGSGCK
jgi:hypothetical protein